MSIIYRRGKSEDLTDVQSVVAAAFNDLNKRRGFGASSANSSPLNPFFGFALERQPDGFWVAEDSGRFVGFSISQLYGSFWFLAYLFVMPDYQGKGLGGEPLKRTWEHGAGIPVTNRALITFAYNPESISLYMKHGLFPCESVCWVTGAGEEVGARLGDKRDRGVLEPIAPGNTASALLGNLDA
jgi:ribosomal protein S18 acetylase RimI-like enzyme